MDIEKSLTNICKILDSSVTRPGGGGELRTSDHRLPTAPDPGPYDPKNPLEDENINGIIIHPSRTLGPRTFLYLNARTSDHWLPAALDPGPPDLVTSGAVSLAFFLKWAATTVV